MVSATVSELRLEKRLIFDDKIAIEIPSFLIDISAFRQVPDNQYCWVSGIEGTGGTAGQVGGGQVGDGTSHGRDSGSFNPGFVGGLQIPNDFSMILELVEMDSCQNVSAYIDELVDSDDSSSLSLSHLLQEKAISITGVLATAASASMAAKLLKMGKFNGKSAENAAQDVLVVMGLVRLLRTETDVLITMNLPLEHLFDNSNGSQGQLQVLIDWALRWTGVMESVLNSFQVVDWSLFG